MGQQLSCESYCVATMQRLAEELKTTNSQVSECQVLDSSWPSNSTASSSMKLQFSWREWQRVSGYLERVLSPSEQRRLIDHLLLDVTGLRTVDLGAIWESVVGVEDNSEFSSIGDDEVFQSSSTTAMPETTSSLNLNASAQWSVHPDWTDGSCNNPLLYRDFTKIHLQLGPMFSVFNLDLPAMLGQPRLTEDGVQAQQSDAETETPSSVSVYGYRASRRLSNASITDLRGYAQAFSDRLADLVRARCSSLGVSYLVTGAQYHASHNCLVISGTVDVRSLLRQSGGIELRSWLNPEAESQELADQLQRSIGHSFDGFMEQQQNGGAKYFPIVMYYCDNRKLVTIIYGLEPKRTAD